MNNAAHTINLVNRSNQIVSYTLVDRTTTLRHEFGATAVRMDRFEAAEEIHERLGNGWVRMH